ncbi:MAG: raffinose/stachyose/melibiose transport system permease protein, partial [Gaiellales bacterium]|nr:raffinose/stachyose/melibiose transport system permease protein [Gaiellales bacterium]
MLRVRPWVPYLYCTPLVALLAFIFGYPLVKVVDFSTRLVRGSSGPFIGLDNYRNAIDDPTFRNAARHSAT